MHEREMSTAQRDCIGPSFRLGLCIGCETDTGNVGEATHVRFSSESIPGPQGHQLPTQSGAACPYSELLGTSELLSIASLSARGRCGCGILLLEPVVPAWLLTGTQASTTTSLESRKGPVLLPGAAFYH